jgi:hypothetical protein
MPRFPPEIARDRAAWPLRNRSTPARCRSFPTTEENVSMNRVSKIGLSLALGLAASTFASVAAARVDCNSPGGVLAMQAAPTISNATDVDDIGGDDLVVRGSTRILANPGADELPGACGAHIRMEVYYATNADALRPLPNVAARADWPALEAAPHVDATLLGNGDPNGRSARAVIPRGRMQPGTVVFYRWAKKISYRNGADPYTWSSIMQLTVPARQQQPAPQRFADLVATDDVDRPLLCVDGGTVGDGRFTYDALSQAFCSSLPQAQFVEDGRLPANFGNASNTPILKLDFALPDLRVRIKNEGQVATGRGFASQIFRGSDTSAQPLFTLASPAMAAGGTEFLTVGGRGRAVVYRFPGFDLTDAKFCYVRRDGTQAPKLERDGYTVRVDSGNAVTEDAGERNNDRRLTCGTRIRP